MKRRLRNVFTGLFILIVVLGIWQWELVGYGIMQGKGQFNILWNARPVEEVLEDPAVPDSLKQKLLLVQDVKAFAVDSLGIKPSENYTTLFDQQGKEVLWLVTACRPYSLEQKQWTFPITGEVSYKGFFDYERALKEKAALDEEGYDTYLRSVGAWSTLGWFRDPVMSNLLFRGDGELVNTIIHELTHGTVFVKDSLDFNENLATFIGHQGAIRYMTYKWGSQSKELQEYLVRNEARHLYSDHMLRGLRHLENLYEGFSESMTPEQKESAKQELIQEIIVQTDTLEVPQAKGYRAFLEQTRPNNAFFMAFERYRGEQGMLQQQLDKRFNGNLSAFLNYYKSRFAR